jgi:hypothetical protein
MSTFFLHAFFPFLLDWLCCAGAPTTEAADNFFFDLMIGAIVYELARARESTGDRRFAAGRRKRKHDLSSLGYSLLGALDADHDYAYRHEAVPPTAPSYDFVYSSLDVPFLFQRLG